MNGRKARRERRRVSDPERAAEVLRRAFETHRCPNCRRHVEAFMTTARPDEPGIGFSCARCDRVAAAALSQSRAARIAPAPMAAAGVPECSVCGNAAVEWDDRPVLVTGSVAGEPVAWLDYLAICEVCLPLLEQDDLDGLVERSQLGWAADVPLPPPSARRRVVELLVGGIRQLREER